jgi:hypothetical protein
VKQTNFWEVEQNGACWTEYEALRDTLSALPKPMRVLEIGPGLGRSLVFFSKKFGWQRCDLHAYEGDGKTTKYMSNGPRFEDSFCGTISELRRVLDYNGITNVTIHDAKSVAMKDLPGPFDLVYGFYTIGFHWSLEHFFGEVLTLIGKTGIAVFTVPPDFRPFVRLLQLPYRLIDKGRMIDEEREKLLILGPAGSTDTSGGKADIGHLLLIDLPTPHRRNSSSGWPSAILKPAGCGPEYICPTR